MTVEGNNIEYLDIVDGNNNIIGKETRANIHKQMLFHRAVHIIVLNTKGEMFIQKRSAINDTYPNHWDVSSAGHLNVGEGYESAAKRELQEELGIENVDLYGGTRHSSVKALREQFSPEQIKRGTMHHSNKAFERYFQIELEDSKKIYQASRGMKNLQKTIYISNKL